MSEQDPILERLEEIVDRAFRAVGFSERIEVRRELRQLLVDVAIECAEACANGDLLTTDYRCEIRQRFGVKEEGKS